MITLRAPTEAEAREFQRRCRKEPFSYTEVGASRDSEPPGFDHDRNRILLGTGDDVFQAACDALLRWRMFPAGWTRVVPDDAPIEPGREVAVLARAFGLWWWNACRIVYVLDDRGPVLRRGFAYGTLDEHVESGEERFTIERLEDGTVRYDLFAFSRPRAPIVRLGYPLARRLQRRFARDSKAAMLCAVAAARGAATGEFVG